VPVPAKPKKPLTAAQKLAIARKQAQDKLVDDLLCALFTNGQEQVAAGMSLKDSVGNPLGGWSKAGAGSQIRDVLNKHGVFG